MEPSGTGRVYGGVSTEVRVAERRQKLLDAGLNLFGVNGFQSVRVRDVCSEAGLTERYFYESFSDMRSLFESVLEETIRDIERDVTAALEKVPERGTSRARVAVRQSVDTMMKDPRKIRLLYVEALGRGGLAAARSHDFNLRAADNLLEWARSDGYGLDPSSAEAIRRGGIAFSGAALELLVSWAGGLIEISAADLSDYIVGLYERIALA